LSLSDTLWLVDPAVLPGFVLAMVLVELTPGPNMGYLAVIAAGRGRLAGMLTVVGVTLGLSAYLVLAVTGLTQGLLQSPMAMTLLRWGGVAYLLFLALDVLQAPSAVAHTLPTNGRLMLRGLVANLLNPKALIFYAVLLPGFVRPGFAAPWVQMLTLGTAHIAISVAVHLGIVLGVAGAVGAWPDRRRRVLRVLSALGLAGVALWLALSP
jgi:threonine/homoserine/homoserine lactone efflux protein